MTNLKDEKLPPIELTLAESTELARLLSEVSSICDTYDDIIDSMRTKLRTARSQWLESLRKAN